MPTAAAVIDLDSFRARRSRSQGAPAVPVPVPVTYAPFWVVWVPAWPVR